MLLNLIIATVLGFLAGMGVGGGSLLLLWLTQVVMLEQADARIINLLFFLPAATVATIFRRKISQIDISAALTATVTGCIAAVIFSQLSEAIDVSLLKKILGGLLILTGIREVFYRPRNAR